MRPPVNSYIPDNKTLQHHVIETERENGKIFKDMLTEAEANMTYDMN